ncbi:hypothetical protein SAMN05216436_1277 [bacterium A37T11]|nr:hypothetical protein SAMN05216436_1277 [bacterium A37T11]
MNLIWIFYICFEFPPCSAMGMNCVLKQIKLCYMKFYSIYSLFIFAVLLGSCSKDNSTPNNGPLAAGYSILVNNGQVLVSGFLSENGRVTTRYWVNDKKVDSTGFTGLVGNQSIFRVAVDDQFRTGYTYKDNAGVIQSYRFNQGTGAENGHIFYYLNNSMVRMNNDSIGILSTVSFHDNTPIFAGSLGVLINNAMNRSIQPKTAFVWDGHSPINELVRPEQSTLFWGVSAVYAVGTNEVYVGGLCGIPMYWKNSDPVVLDSRYGEVWQITKSGPDVYAVGLLNKHNSNSTGHTACYWKNGTLYELEDNAQAYAICIDGEDVYISGAVGNVPVNYHPCYWKNGVRVDLPMI